MVMNTEELQRPETDEEKKYYAVVKNLQDNLEKLQNTETAKSNPGGLAKQMMLQFMQHIDKLRVSCFNQAQDHRIQAQKCEVQGNAYTALASIANAIANGYLNIDQRRIQEELERKQIEDGIMRPRTVSASGAGAEEFEEHKPQVSDSHNTESSVNVEVKTKSKPPPHKNKNS